MLSSRRLLWMTVLAFAACRPAPHIDLKLNLQCVPAAGDPPPPTSCEMLTLDCANFVEVRAYEVDAQGTRLRILGSNCLATSQLGSPKDLCALANQATPLPLLSGLPDGARIQFQMRALKAQDPKNRCFDDLPAQQTPLKIFDGYTAAVPIDGSDHLAPIEIGFCGSCLNLRGPPPMTPDPRCMAGQKEVLSPHPGAAYCCPDPLPAGCLATGSSCADGSLALIGPGGCCAQCPPR